MKINSIKLTVVVMLVLMITGILIGLFFIEIPEGNREVAYMLLGIIGTTLVRAIADLFKKE